MKINGVVSTVMNMNHKGYQINNQNTKNNIDTVTLSNTQASTTNLKSSGDLFAMYLDEIGYYDGMNVETKDALVASIKQNVYSFDEATFYSVYDSSRKVNNSVLYLKSLVPNIKSVDLRQEFTSLINTYKDVTNKQVNDYQAQLLAEEHRVIEQENIQTLNSKLAETEMLLQQLESSKEQADAMEEEFDVLSKCMTIAMRILDGHDVPSEDVEFLMENNPDLYEMAISMRKQNDDKKEYDSVLDDEDSKIEVEFEVSEEDSNLKMIISNKDEGEA